MDLASVWPSALLRRLPHVLDFSYQGRHSRYQSLPEPERAYKGRYHAQDHGAKSWQNLEENNGFLNTPFV